MAAFQFNPPQAITPGSEPADSIRVAVTTLDNFVAVGARVAFAVTAGGGTVSPASDTVKTSGIVSTKWTLGPTAGTNTVTATVVDANGAPITWVKGSPVTFTVKTYAALTTVEGDAQTGNVLAALPVAPSIRLVDSAGKPRPGIPVTFAPTGNGRVANTVVSTSVDGIASPGVWTLGDLAGDRAARRDGREGQAHLHATATGTATRFAAVQVATSTTATCAVTVDRLVSCMGRPPMIGTGDTASKSSPTLTKGGVHLTSLAGGAKSLLRHDGRPLDLLLGRERPGRYHQRIHGGDLRAHASTEQHRLDPSHAGRGAQLRSRERLYGVLLGFRCVGSARR